MRTLRSIGHIPYNVGIDQGCFHILMTEKLLDLPNISSVQQNVGGKTVSEGMDRCMFWNICLFEHRTYCMLDCLITDMVPSYLPRPRINGRPICRKNILPCQVISCVEPVEKVDLNKIGFYDIK